MIDAVDEHARVRRVHHAHARAGARGGQARRAGLQGRHRAPARRADARRQGPVRHRGRAHDLRLEHLRRPRADADARGGREGRATAGAIVVGKTLTHEFAWGITSVNPHFPPCRNPHDPERVAGRLAAAARRWRSALGQAALALGTDTGGSIRIPASFCGVSGLKPTYGLLSTGRRLSRSPARSITPARWRARPRTCKLLLRGARATARRTSPRRGSRSAPTCTCARWSPASSASFDARRGRARARSSRSRFDARRAGSTRPTRRSRTARPRRPTPQLFPARRDEYGEDVAGPDRARAARHARRVHRGDRRARAHPRRLPRACSRVADLLLTPIAAVPPELREQPDPQGFRDGVLPYTVPQDLAGLPTCAVPVGFDDRRPAGRRSSSPGPPRSEARVLAAAEALFSATASARAGSASAPVICGISIPTSSTKHQHHSSPGSSERMIGCSVARGVRARVLVRRVVAAADVPARRGRCAGAARRRRSRGSPRSRRPPPAAR